ncbi:unnamed protein product [Cuscuta campestris]|uniref:Auxin response factor n=1 Tax=Cuscuta campestris TaxID=132261 RepID=A0A484LRB9_9ASTE|nr:unnamed protein product [Cuscuta campestris]
MVNEVVERCLDSKLWHACAGGMAQIPPVGSQVFYFPQGHAEHANKSMDFGGYPTIPSLLLCSVSSIRYLADLESDEVYAKIRLVPLKEDVCDDDDDVDDEGRFLASFGNNEKKQEKPTNSFAKTLTQSDANNGGGFSVPRYCAEMIFPRLDYTAEPPLQTVVAKDVHGVSWKFRHIYRGTPRRHLLTTGWSNFVNQKKLVAGDSIVFLRAENGELFVGIRRAKRGMSPKSSGWNTRGFFGHSGNCVEARTLAGRSQPFEVVFYPRACTPEFVVKASVVREAMRIRWCPGMRFKMPFETEDSSRISWFMGTVSSVRVDDPIRWPNSPWRLLQVTWDEPDLLQNVKGVSPWLVELVSSIPSVSAIHLSPPRKKLRLPQPLEFPTVGHITASPSFTLHSIINTNPLMIPSSPVSSCVSDNLPAGIQGARQVQFGLFPFDSCEKDGSLSCLLTIGKTSPDSKEKKKKPRELMLFGKAILVEDRKDEKFMFGLDDENGDRRCKVFVESDDVGRGIIDLSATCLGSEDRRCRAMCCTRILPVRSGTSETNPSVDS